MTVSGLTVENPYPYSYTGGEPVAVVLEDHDSGDTINVVGDDIIEGTADSHASTDFPIGVDTFLNAATTSISGDSISGFFQGALLEDNGPAMVGHDEFRSLIRGTDTSTSPSHYSGYGIAESAGYTGGYVTPDCVANGSLHTTVAHNSFALTGSSRAAAISLEANGTGNNLSGSVTANSGYVTSPSKGIVVRSTSVPATPPGTDCSPYGTSNGGGGTLEVTTRSNSVTVKAASHSAATSQSTTPSRMGALHAPRFAHHRG